MLSAATNRGEHRMVLIVVSVHAVPAQPEQVLKLVNVLPDPIQTVVGPEVRGVGLFHADHGTVENLISIDDRGILSRAPKNTAAAMTAAVSARGRSWIAANGPDSRPIPNLNKKWEKIPAFCKALPNPSVPS
jgi:hypothetical protein